MKLQKWNKHLGKYVEYDSPAKIPVFMSKNLSDIIQCANCGKECLYGDTYTSRLIHNKVGFGYCVCAECYKKEF